MRAQRILSSTVICESVTLSCEIKLSHSVYRVISDHLCPHVATAPIIICKIHPSVEFVRFVIFSILDNIFFMASLPRIRTKLFHKFVFRTNVIIQAVLYQ